MASLAEHVVDISSLASFTRGWPSGWQQAVQPAEACSLLTAWATNHAARVCELPTDALCALLHHADAADPTSQVWECLLSCCHGVEPKVELMSCSEEEDTGEQLLALALLASQVLQQRSGPGLRLHTKLQASALKCLRCICRHTSWNLRTSQDPSHALSVYRSVSQGVITLTVSSLTTPAPASHTGPRLTIQDLADVWVDLAGPTTTPDAPACAMHTAGHALPADTPPSVWRLFSSRTRVHQLLGAAAELLATSGASKAQQQQASAGTTAITTFLQLYLVTLVKCDITSGLEVLMSLADLLTPRDTTLAGRSTLKACALPLPERELLLQVLIAATTQLQDPVVAGMVLSHMQSCQDLHSKPALRKLVLDLAALALSSPSSDMTVFATSILEQGCHDRDATVRARALSLWRDQVPKVWELHVISAGDPAAPGSGDSAPTEAVTRVLSTRLLDSSKTVRLKAVKLLQDSLLWEPARTTSSAGHKLAEGKKAMAVSLFPVVCCLLDARQDSALYDKAAVPALEELTQVVMRVLGPAEVMKLLLATSTSSVPEQQLLGDGSVGAAGSKDVVCTANSASHGSAQEGLLQGRQLSSGLFEVLMQQCQSLSVQDSYQVWAGHVTSLQSRDQVLHLSRLARRLPQASAMHQHAMRVVCQQMACMAAATEDPQQLQTWLRHTREAVQVAHILPVSLPTSGATPPQGPRQHNTQKEANVFTEQRVPDTTCELAVVMDLARALQQLSQQLSQQTHSSPATAAPATPSLQRAATQCMAWCFRAAQTVLRRAGLTPTAPEQRTGTGSSRQSLDPALAASRVVLRSLNTMLAAGLLGNMGHSVGDSESHGTQQGQVRPAQAPGVGVVDSALELLCSCRPVPTALRHATVLLQQLETQATHRSTQLQSRQEAAQVEPGTAAAGVPPGVCDEVGDCSNRSQQGVSLQLEQQLPGSFLSQSDIQTYLLLLYHMCQLYEAEAEDFRVRAAKQATHPVAPPGAVEGSSVPAASAAQPTVTADSDAKAGPGMGEDHNYMAQEEAAQAIAAMTQSYLEEVMGRTPPATRVPVLVGLLQLPAGALPPALRALAVRVLTRLMVMSDALATQHQPLLANLLTEPLCNPCQPHDHLRTTLPAARGDSQDPLLVVTEVLHATATLMVQRPNVNSGLLAPLEKLLAGLLDQRADHTQPGACTRALVQTMGCYSEVLSCDKLQLTGATWRLLGRCALSSVTQVSSLAVAVLHTLTSQQTAAAAKKPKARAGKATAPGSVNVAQGTYGALLALYSNCDPAHRQQLVEQVVLGALLVSPSDLCNDGLVLPVLQSLSLADTGTGRAAAVALLNQMTPSSRALAALNSMLQKQSLGLGRVHPGEARSVLQTLTRFAARYQSSAQVTPGPSANTTATDAHVGTSSGGPVGVGSTAVIADGPGEAPPVPSSWRKQARSSGDVSASGAGAALQARVLSALQDLGDGRPTVATTQVVSVKQSDSQVQLPSKPGRSHSTRSRRR